MIRFRRLTALALAATSATSGFGYAAAARNPIIANQGVNDPHVHVFGDTAYLYASHDTSARSKTFVMENWQVWSSDDLVTWQLRSTLYPDQTYIGDRPGFASAWATDVAEKNGRWYWYFSEGNSQTGVVVGDSPVGPWRDPLGKPLLTEDLTPTHEYDPGLFAEGNERYIVFGVWDYHLARLGDDMISLAEKPRKIEIMGARGPYTEAKGTPFDGKLTDDKPFLHKRGRLYYLSWGAFYATSESLYGPYQYRGRILEPRSFPTGLDKPTWPVGYWQGRHGSFFSWHGQDYFAYCDISQGGNRYYRDTFVSYVHYRADGSIAPIRVDLTGVGEYEAASGAIEAEDFFANEGFAKVEIGTASSEFAMALAGGGKGSLTYPNIHGLPGRSAIVLTFTDAAPASGTITISRRGATGPIARLPLAPHRDAKRAITIPLGPLGETESLVISVANTGSTALSIDTVGFR